MRRPLALPLLVTACVLAGTWFTTAGHLSAAPAEGLRTTVRLQEHDITLAELFKRVGRESRLEYSVHPDAGWQHVTVFATGITVKDLHELLRQVVLWEITPEKNSNTRFRAAPSPRRAALAREALKRAEAVYRSDLSHVLALAGRGIEEPGLWERATRGNMLSLGQHRELFRFLRALPPGVLDRVMGGDMVTLQFDNVDYGLRGPLERAYEQGTFPPEYGSPQRIELRVVPDNAGLPKQLDVTYQFAKPEQRVHLYTAHRSAMSRFTGSETPDAGPRLTKEAAKLLATKVRAAPRSPRPKLPRTATELSVSLLELHRRNGLTVLSDSYPHWMENAEAQPHVDPEPSRLDHLTVGEAVRVIADRYYSWDVVKGAVVTRSKSWAALIELERRYHPGLKSGETKVESCCP
jgi:hypothetical protein